jgi:hypothetical protein
VPEASKSCSANRCRIARCPQRFVAVILSPDRLGHLVGVRSYVAAIVKGRFGSGPEIQTRAKPLPGVCKRQTQRSKDRAPRGRSEASCPPPPGSSKPWIEAMPRTFKQWTPATAELELLHECWLARLPPAMIAARLCISEPSCGGFIRRGRCPGRNLPGRASRAIKRRRSACCEPLRRIAGRLAGSHSELQHAVVSNGGGGGECGPVKIEIKSN